MNRSIFKAYDIRGIYPTDINEASVTTIGKACVHIMNEGELIIAYDARHGSPEMAAVVEKAILEEAARLNKKITTRNIGFASTPMFYFSVNHFNASGGCMITASHNPREYNGLKIVREKAVMISGVSVLEAIDNANLA